MKGAVVKPQLKVKEPVGSEAMFREGEDNSKLDGQPSTADTSSKVEVTIRDSITTAKPPLQDPKGDETIKQEPGSFRNSGRVRKLPAHLIDYVLDYTAVSFIEYMYRVTLTCNRTMHGVCLPFLKPRNMLIRKKS